jgi:hypothetical protein
VKARVKKEVLELTENFPLYAHRLRTGKSDSISAS